MSVSSIRNLYSCTLSDSLRRQTVVPQPHYSPLSLHPNFFPHLSRSTTTSRHPFPLHCLIMCDAQLPVRSVPKQTHQRIRSSGALSLAHTKPDHLCATLGHIFKLRGLWFSRVNNHICSCHRSHFPATHRIPAVSRR